MNITRVVVVNDLVIKIPATVLYIASTNYSCMELQWSLDKPSWMGPDWLGLLEMVGFKS